MTSNPVPIRPRLRAARANLPRGLALALAALLVDALPARATQIPATARPGELTLALEALVDLPRPGDRRGAARELAAGEEHSLEDLLAAMRGFGRFVPLDPGLETLTVPLQVGAEVEETELLLYVPRGYAPDRPAPLLASFHGTGGSGRHAVGMWTRIADELGMLVLAPSEAGPNLGYTFSDRERDAAMAALRWVRRRCNVDEDRVFLTGVSRGGHLAWDLALRFPDRFAALAPMIGGPRIQVRQAQNNLRYMENVAQLPIRDLQGAQDDRGLVFNLRLAFARLERFGAPDAELLLQEHHGHGFDFGAVDWVAFLGGARREPFPERVVRSAAREAEARAAFVEITGLDKKVEEDFEPRVRAAKWSRLDDEGRRRFLQELADERTARLEVRRVAADRYEADGDGVERFRLLLPREALEPGQLTLVWKGRTLRRRPKPSKELLLEEFAERFDRRFLPVAEVEAR